MALIKLKRKDGISEVVSAEIAFNTIKIGSFVFPLKELKQHIRIFGYDDFEILEG